ncbi:MAG: hypothetical protein AMQ74_01810 [Candidatus Methanofastidiosum methylothiophilum]|uniref:Uncharacterized protein n=1 Tax=Candidatus Methanofastidiosum methylothiophilum TaxID=1705564 RepID=A0A150INR6_9EURY|nr:MAG: hypothetical protein AMQ74_01810 [Candidatus Methanofastidiosum methylthiophilus]NMC75704.1 hypothetical protein [Candidatus Methanofastidiosa archaeon]
MDKKEHPKCINCNSNSHVIPIVYGYPTSKDFQDYERGDLKLGGIITSGQQFKWFCKKCDRNF